MWSCYFVLLVFISRNNVVLTSAINNIYIESFVDGKVCDDHLNVLARTDLGRIFRESSAYITPDTIRLDEKVSLGSYSQCLSINKEIPTNQIQERSTDDNEVSTNQVEGFNQKNPITNRIEGKYCLLKVDVPRAYIKDELLNDVGWPDNATVVNVRNQREKLDRFCGVKSFPWIDYRNFLHIDVGVCIPKSCSSGKASKWILNSFGNSNVWSEVFKSSVHSEDLNYRAVSCRVPDDKTFGIVDWMAVACLALLFVMALSSTVYDLKTKDNKSTKSLLRSFSIYSNSLQLTRSESSKGSVECVDGIRALSMFWIMLLHAYYHRLNGYFKKTDMELALISSGLFAVDTFLLLSGIFVVYSTTGRFNTKTFLNQLPIFYLNRLVRLLPILLLMMLLQASLLNHISDGPNWYQIAHNVDTCRTNWLFSLLFIDNIVQVCQFKLPTRCLTHAWYIDLDTQMYVLSPLVLYWLLKSKRSAFTALSTSIVILLATTAFFSFAFKFSFNDLHNINHRYNADYYVKFMYTNPLTRGTPFFIGMLCGYVLYLAKENNIHLNKMTKTTGWIITLLVIFPSLYLMDLVLKADIENDILNSILNTFWRNIWSLAVGWIIFACHHGFGGIINWFLSLNLWKLPSKLSYTMYLVHYPIYRIILAEVSEARTYTPGSEFYSFLSVSAMTIILSFILSVTLELPIANLYKIITAQKDKSEERR